MTKKIIVFLTFILFITLFSPSFASTLRLMAMGDMQGIVEDESDYQFDITSFDFKQNKNLSVEYFNTYFSNYFPQNDVPSNLIYDLERKGAEDQYRLNAFYPIDSNLAVGIGYSKATRDFRSSYINSNGDAQTLKRVGNTEMKGIIVGYALTDWFNLGLAYDDNVVNDDYTGTEASREGVFASENSNFSGLSYGIKLYNPSFWFNLTMGDIKNTNLTSQVISTTEVYRSSGPGRMSLLVGGKLLDGKVRINYGGFGKKIGYGTQMRSLLGTQIKPIDELTLGFGYTYDLNTSQYFDFYNLASRIGVEYALPRLGALKFRGGLINRSCEIRGAFWGLGRSTTNFQDYTFGAGYDWGKIKFDFAYKNYQDVSGSGINWLTTSTPLNFDYVPSFSNERSSIYVFSVDYEI